jgi:all-trans-8'-apo-beta-carotenal 15,15'-oxygenase
MSPSSAPRAIPAGRPAVSRWASALQDLGREHGFLPLSVEGRLPDDLAGTLYRAVPARFTTARGRHAHWFDVEGAIAAVRFEAGRALGAVRFAAAPAPRSARSRPGFAQRATGLREHLEAVVRRRFHEAANTQVLPWGGQLLALYEPGLPTSVDPLTLEARGRWDGGGAIRGPFSAHPHLSPARGTLYNFGVEYGPLRTHAALYALTSAGARCVARVPLRGRPMIHDFAVTNRYAIFFVAPLELDLWGPLLGRRSVADSLSWHPEQGIEVVIVDLDDPTRVTRAQIPAGWQWHFANAYDEGDAVVCDLVQHPDYAGSDAYLRAIYEGRSPGPGRAAGSLLRARLAPRKGRWTVSLTPLSDAPVEMPRVAQEGGPQRFVYALGHTCASAAAAGPADAVMKIDTHSGIVLCSAIGDETYPSEPVFVPAASAAREDDGYLLTQVFDARRGSTDFVVLSAMDPGRVVARARFGQALPFSFHGSWAPR